MALKPAMTLAWDLIVWGGVALLLLGVRGLAQFERRRGYDDGWTDAIEHFANAARTDPERDEPR